MKPNWHKVTNIRWANRNEDGSYEAVEPRADWMHDFTFDSEDDTPIVRDKTITFTMRFWVIVQGLWRRFSVN